MFLLFTRLIRLLVRLLLAQHMAVEEMDERLIKNWNSVVQNGDTTYILGDFCWGKEPEWKRIVPLLNGNKVLIRGNHDLKEMTSSLKKMFQDIKDYKEITDGGRHVFQQA